MNSALTLFSVALDSPTFRVLSTALLVVLVVNRHCQLWASQSGRVAKREVLILKDDPRLKKKSLTRMNRERRKIV